MNKLISFRRFLPVALVVGVGAVLFSGCATCKRGKTGPALSYNLSIRLGNTLKDSSVVVDVIGANPSDLERLRTCSVNKYWKPGDPLRHDLPMSSFSFVSGSKLQGALAATDPKWQQWVSSGVQYLVVIADLPGVFDDGKMGSQDPRRQIVPICQCYWPDGTKDLAVEVQASGVRVVTAPRPEGFPLPLGW